MYDGDGMWENAGGAEADGTLWNKGNPATGDSGNTKGTADPAGDTGGGGGDCEGGADGGADAGGDCGGCD